MNQGMMNIAPYLEQIEKLTRPIILHIGDTNSKNYPLFRELFKEIQPETIIHTGDTADEVKVGRIPETRGEYLEKIPIILKDMADTGARLIVVPGNNDLPEEIQKIVPQAEVYPRNTVVSIDGIECRVGHEVRFMTFDKEWSFYGHGLTGEEWTMEKNTRKPYRFNTSWGAFVCSMADETYVHIPIPED